LDKGDDCSCGRKDKTQGENRERWGRRERREDRKDRKRETRSPIGRLAAAYLPPSLSLSLAAYRRDSRLRKDFSDFINLVYWKP
jgi:hypothetical protein